MPMPEALHTDPTRCWQRITMAPKKAATSKKDAASSSDTLPHVPEAEASGDLELEVEGQRLRVHSQLLALASPVLRGLLESCQGSQSWGSAVKVCRTDFLGRLLRPMATRCRCWMLRQGSQPDDRRPRLCSPS